MADAGADKHIERLFRHPRAEPGVSLPKRYDIRRMALHERQNAIQIGVPAGIATGVNVHVMARTIDLDFNALIPETRRWREGDGSRE